MYYRRRQPAAIARRAPVLRHRSVCLHTTSDRRSHQRRSVRARDRLPESLRVLSTGNTQHASDDDDAIVSLVGKYLVNRLGHTAVL